jgi:chromate transporter
MILWELFLSFFRIGFFSFGGGYAMIPVIEYEVLNHGWLDPQQLTYAITIAGMLPGPIATNCAIYVGFTTHGILGALVATIAISLPSLIILLTITHCIANFYHHPILLTAIESLRPIITGLIVYAAVRLALNNQIIGTSDGVDITGFMIMVSTLIILVLTNLNPVFILLAAGGLGILMYY